MIKKNLDYFFLLFTWRFLGISGLVFSGQEIARERQNLIILFNINNKNGPRFKFTVGLWLLGLNFLIHIIQRAIDVKLDGDLVTLGPSVLTAKPVIFGRPLLCLSVSFSSFISSFKNVESSLNTFVLEAAGLCVLRLKLNERVRDETRLGLNTEFRCRAV